MAARVRALWIAEGALHSGCLESVPSDVSGPVWIDVEDPDEESLSAVSERFFLPPLAVEDCLHFPQRPKLDTYPDVTFIVWVVPALDADERVTTQEVDIFLGKEHVVTVHDAGVPALSRVLEQADEHLARGAEWTVHAILDASSDDVFPVLDVISDALEELEDRVLVEPAGQDLQRLHVLKRSLMGLHRIVGPERDVVRALTRLEAFVEPEAYMYFEDVGDHLARLADSIDTYREVASGTAELYLSAQGNRMNDIMKRLTVVATIFMPLTLITGIYGMNVLAGMWPPADASWSFGLIVSAMAIIAVWMALYFRRKHWW